MFSYNALTCMHSIRYTAYTMQETSLQLTIRGLNKKTKQALQQKASQQGISLNKVALKALEQGAGIDQDAERYQVLKQFLNNHSMDKTDKLAFDEALAWSDKVSRAKQDVDDSRI